MIALLIVCGLGDFIGIYSREDGLGVTRVWIFIITNARPMFWNVSFKKESMKVVDSQFVEYVKKYTMHYR
ncbi:N-acetylmuramoyl-L-alanine amidase-like domain-containing protein [Burkholderia sp. ABCPW 14]|uniref:N-acetylmuramoyl-L-alanine amidase-like domain-containing protein n=1 Tax=Burkholderia sp. ABCPW 14 TaxID=1637860 RepID=UPI0009E6D2E7